MNIPSVLIEYGYITEPRFVEPQHRQTLTSDLAYQTYLAIQDFFDDPVENPRAVTKLPIEWPKPVVATTTLPVVSTTTPVITPPSNLATTSPITVPPKVATTTAAVATAGAGTCAAFTKPLMRDITGAEGEVKQLQAILAKDTTVYPEGVVNGIFGPATERAVQRFQKKHGIASSGTAATTGYGAVGPKTAKALLALCK